MNNIIITAKMAHDRADAALQTANEEWLDTVYKLIAGAAKDGRYTVECEIPNIEIGDYVFEKLVANDYYVEMEAKSYDVNDHTMRLVIGWEDMPWNNDKKYVLPLEDTERTTPLVNTTRLYAFKRDSGEWTVVFGGHIDDIIEEGACVTAKDLDDAPDWVKAIQPIEVKD